MKKLLILYLLIGVISISACSNEMAIYSNDEDFPTEKWVYVNNPGEYLEIGKIDEMFEYIKDKEVEYTSLIIIKDKKILLEEYFDSNEANEMTALYSATKSINSALVGIAIENGYINDVDQKVMEFFIDDFRIFNITPEKESVSLKNILTMSCGFNWNEWEFPYGDNRNIYETWKNSGNRFKFLLDTSMREKPGESFNYNTAASNLIPYIINHSTGIPTDEFAQKYLFGPLGINEEDYIWSKDNLSYCKGGGLNMRPLDMAKIGILYLNEGRWESRQVIPKEWIRESFKPYFDVRLGTEFGYHWYVNKFKELQFFSAEGYMEQKIIVCPEKELVVVFTGNVDDYSRDNSDIIFKRYILPGLRY